MADRENDVLQISAHVSTEDGGLRFTYPDPYSGTLFYLQDNELYGYTPGGVQVPVFTLENGILTATVDERGQSRFRQYLSALDKPFRKLAKLEFLQPDGSTAFTLDNNYRRGWRKKHDTRAFIQDGSLEVSLNNGQRRKATINLSNVDGAFSYNVNTLWFGKQVRLSMGLILPDGTEFYLPQGVFYISNPNATISPDGKTISYDLVDKWSYLDGSLFGTMENTYVVKTESEGSKVNVFNAMRAVLLTNKFTHGYQSGAAYSSVVDPITPVFPTYYNGRKYAIKGGGYANMTDVPYDITVEAGKTLADIELELNNILAGLIGYDMTGALRVEPSETDVSDKDKPVLYAFTPKNSRFCGMSETAKDEEVYNDVFVVAEGLDGSEIWGRATNMDPQSDTNVNLIGRKTLYESNGTYYSVAQCAALAEWELKHKTVLQKSIAIECQQMFHLMENRLVSVQRTDKPGNPTEKHIIQSFSIPIGETGSMTINCTSVNDLPQATITTATV